jgi:enoyl-CoA hydratase
MALNRVRSANGMRGWTKGYSGQEAERIMSESGEVLSRKDGRTGHLVFSNPSRHNAVSLSMWKQAGRLLKEFAGDAGIGVVVLSGAGNKSFVSGADISKFEKERANASAARDYGAAVEEVYAAVHDFPKPTIAMIRGYCIGGGLGLAISCDLRIAATHSRFAMPAAKLGLGYDLPGMRRFIEVLGASFTKEMFFTARQFDVEEAQLMRLVNRVVPNDQIEEFTRDYAETIAANAPLTMAAAKFVVTELAKDPDERDLAGCTARIDRCFESRDYEEGRRAFLEKRKPVFTGV